MGRVNEFLDWLETVLSDMEPVNRHSDDSPLDPPTGDFAPIDPLEAP